MNLLNDWAVWVTISGISWGIVGLLDLIRRTRQHRYPDSNLQAFWWLAVAGPFVWMISLIMLMVDFIDALFPERQ